MKIRLLLVIGLIGLMTATAQDLREDSTDRPPHKLSIGIAAGPALIRFTNKAYFPTLTGQTGVFVNLALKKMDFRMTAQYYPMHVTYKDANDYADFTNHVINVMALTQLPIAFKRRLTFDIGASLANGISHEHSDYAEVPPYIQFGGPIGEPVEIRNQFSLMLGSSWKLRKHDQINLTALLFDEQYMIQASFSHTF